MKLMCLDLPDNEGQVTIMTRPLRYPEPTTMLQAFDLPLRQFALWHGCGGLMEFVTVSPRKTVLFCANCGSRTRVGTFAQLFQLVLWAALYCSLDREQMALPLSQGEWNVFTGKVCRDGRKPRP